MEIERVTSSSSVWRKSSSFDNNSMNKEDDDDEEALKWDAIQKLPSVVRLRRGLLATPDGVTSQIDVKKLGVQERGYLLERLVKIAEEDNEKFLLKLRNRIDRVGVKIPTIEVRFENLKVEAEVQVASRALPTFSNFIFNIVEGLLNSSRLLGKRQRINILQGVSGIIKPARLTLLLGPPSSGKTTLLLALAGKLNTKLKLDGKVTYNGHEMHEFVAERTCAYVSQDDVHIGEMTVRETLSFSARCQGIGSRYERSVGRELGGPIDNGGVGGIEVLGLEICADTFVGNAMLRGISGGQRKRVTTAEMLVGSARTLFMDEISTGLDSSTTFQIVNSLKQYVQLMKGTAVISLLQPPPETFNLFDDIILLSDGHIVYQGPCEHVLQFFALKGFKCPQRKGVADFLQEVTSRKDQEQYWAKKDQTYRFVTAKEFAEEFRSFHIGRSLGDELATEFDKSNSHPAALAKNKYGVGKWELLKACLSREFLLMKRNSFTYVFKFCQVAMMALVAMTVFLRTEMHKDSMSDGGVYAGALFYGLFVVMFNGSSEVTMVVQRLPVFYKQRNFLFYPAWAYGLPQWILRIPITLIEVLLWVLLTYFVIGFDPQFGRMSRQWLILALANQMASGLFRLIAGIGREMIAASTIGAFVLTIVFAMSGFVLSKDNIRKGWIWGYWISPMVYAQNALMNNEFLGKSWRHVLPNSTESLGVEVLKSRGFFTESNWYWIALEGSHTAKSPENSLNEENGGSTSVQSLSKRKETAASAAAAEPNRKRGMVLPFEAHFITFDEVTYAVDMPQEMRKHGVVEEKLVLLKGVSGAFRPHVLTALMGITGAGKTTLMDVLAGRKTGGYIGGNITISGYPKKQETFARISGYCEQNDIHSPHVTVYESLFFSAWLRLSAEINLETRKMFIDEVMELVELTPLRNAIVGLPGVNGLSTEQRKRLTIAVELVANPSIIFMDEPTSGLDARAAAIVMRAVRNIVDIGRTIVCTIHQPSIHIFESFDELFLMKKGGQEIYVGPLGHNSSDLIHYFQGIQGVNAISDGYNPATWMLEVTTSAKEMELGIDFAELYKNSDLYRRNKNLIRELSTPKPYSKELHFPSKYSRSFFTQCMACLWKQHWSYWRNPLYTAIRFLLTTTLALVLGSMFWKLGSKIEKQQDLFNSMGLMYVAVMLIGNKNATSVLSVVTVERTVFYREQAAGMYSPLAYAFAQASNFFWALIEIPHVLLQSVVYGGIVYAMIGYEWTVTKFIWYLFFMFFTFLYFTYYGMMMAATAPNPHIASIVGSATYSMWNLFSGFLIPPTRIPIWWRWYNLINPAAWSLYGLVASQYGDIKENTESNGIYVPVKDFLRSYYGFRHEFLGVVATIVVGFSLVFALIFAVFIKMINYQRR
ncbi:transcription factor [Stylosanthes scabra]|uniref:Transcription factor n=1 Tax=Stylosanthes scabra TaxID=79078 RepID=A0ABU6T2Q2_9FABA|nr:transcription factor [Stylosanthes scabra]